MQDKIIRLKKGKSGISRPGHPWIYKGQILREGGAISPGAIVSVLDPTGFFLGRGYYNPKSDISVRLLTFRDEPITKGLFEERMRSAAERRREVSNTNAMRMVFSEADGLPGLIVDLYSDTAVFQILTFGMERMKPLLADIIKEVLKPKYLYEKSDSLYRKIEGLKESKKWWGEKSGGMVEIFEGRVKFIVDIENGAKTGFYLDQRKSRMSLDGISKGKRVLDLFSYTGGFAVSAAVYGAASAIGVEIKRQWLDLGRQNAALNGVAARVKFEEGDAFGILRKIYNSGERFDIIIVDPPSFMRTRKDIAGASKGYKELNLTAMKTLNDKGILATFSCSYGMSYDRFSGIVKAAARDAKKAIRILKRCRQPKDHPIVKAIPETEYLKGYFLEITTT